MSEIGTELRITEIAAGFELAGELDAHTAPDLDARLAEHLVASSDVELDLGGVTFMDSSGLRVLIDVTASCRRRGGDLALVAPTATVSRLFSVSGLADHFTIRDRS